MSFFSGDQLIHTAEWRNIAVAYCRYANHFVPISKDQKL